MSENTIASLEKNDSDVGEALSRQGIARAASIVMVAFALSGTLGLVRQMVLAGLFGAGQELDAFYAALRLPETLFTLVAGGALGSAFIPVFSGFLTKDEFQKAWRLVNAILTWVIIVAAFSALIGFVFADPITKTILVRGASAKTQTLTVELMRIMLLTVVLFAISGLFMGILNAHQRFLAPSLAPSMYNVGIILGTVVLSPSLGVYGLAWGTVIGAGLHLGVQIPILLRLPHRYALRPSLQLSTEGVIEVLRLMGPRLFGLMIVQINFWVNVALASAMTQGSLTALNIAFALMFTVLGILGQSLGTAVFPSLSALYAKGDIQEFSRTFTHTLANVLFLSIPAGLGMFILSRPIIQVLFERSEWSSADTSATSWALMFYALGLAGHTALEILARTFYALHDTWTPVIVGATAMVFNIVLSFVFVLIFEALGADTFTRGAFGGLALANSLATALESTALWFILKRRIAEIETGPVLSVFIGTLVSSLAMVSGVALWLWISDTLFPLLRLLIGIGLGMGIFWGMAMLLRVEQAHSVPRQILARFR